MCSYSVMVLLFAVGAISRSERSSAPRLWRSSLRTETRSALALGLDCPFPGPRTAAFGAARAGCQRGSRWRRISRPGGVSSASAGVWWTTVTISAVGSSIRANIWSMLGATVLAGSPGPGYVELWT